MGKRKGEFEDQTVTHFARHGGLIELGMICRLAGTDSKVTVYFENTGIVRNGGSGVPDIKMLSLDGEMIHFETDAHHARLIIIWRDIEKRTSQTEVYQFDFSSMRILRG